MVIWEEDDGCFFRVSGTRDCTIKEMGVCG